MRLDRFCPATTPFPCQMLFGNIWTIPMNLRICLRTTIWNMRSIFVMVSSNLSMRLFSTRAERFIATRWICPTWFNPTCTQAQSDTSDVSLFATHESLNASKFGYNERYIDSVLARVDTMNVASSSLCSHEMAYDVCWTLCSHELTKKQRHTLAADFWPIRLFGTPPTQNVLF